MRALLPWLVDDAWSTYHPVAQFRISQVHAPEREAPDPIQVIVPGERR